MKQLKMEGIRNPNDFVFVFTCGKFLSQRAFNSNQVFSCFVDNNFCSFIPKFF